MSEELDWGPKRPPAVSWAGGLVLVLALAQLTAIGTATLLDSDVFLHARADRIVTASVGGLLGLQILSAVGVLRLWRWWRGIAMVLCVLGAAIQGANLAGLPDRPFVVTISVVLAVAYVLAFALLARSRDAFA